MVKEFGRPVSDIYKKVGIAGCKELSSISNVPESTLSDWRKTRPFVFEAVLEKAVKIKHKRKLKND